MGENKHDDGVDHRVSGPVSKQKDSSFVKDLLDFGINEYLLPKSLDFAHGLITNLINMAADTAIGMNDKAFENSDYPVYRSSRSSRSNSSGKNDYNKMSTEAAKSKGPKDGKMPIDTRPYANPIVVHDQDTANKIKREMVKLITEYGHARVGDLYELADKPPVSFQDWEFGWDDPRDIRYRTVRRDEFVFDLPDPVQLSKR